MKYFGLAPIFRSTSYESFRTLEAHPILVPLSMLVFRGLRLRGHVAEAADLCRGMVPEGTMRPHFVVIPSPVINFFLRIVKRQKPVGV